MLCSLRIACSYDDQYYGLFHVTYETYEKWNMCNYQKIILGIRGV